MEFGIYQFKDKTIARVVDTYITPTGLTNNILVDHNTQETFYLTDSEMRLNSATILIHV